MSKSEQPQQRPLWCVRQIVSRIQLRKRLECEGRRGTHRTTGPQLHWNQLQWIFLAGVMAVQKNGAESQPLFAASNFLSPNGIPPSSSGAVEVEGPQPPHWVTGTKSGSLSPSNKSKYLQ